MNSMTVNETLKEIRKNLKGTGLILRIQNSKLNGARLYAFEDDFGRYVISNMLISSAYENTLNDFLDHYKKS